MIADVKITACKDDKSYFAKQHHFPSAEKRSYNLIFIFVNNKIKLVFD